MENPLDLTLMLLVNLICYGLRSRPSEKSFANLVHVRKHWITATCRHNAGPTLLALASIKSKCDQRYLVSGGIWIHTGTAPYGCLTMTLRPINLLLSSCRSRPVIYLPQILPS